MAAVERLRTSELLHLAASELATRTHRSAPQEVDRLQELATELRVRARWIEGARRDTGVSDDRRAGLAAVDEPIDDSDAKEVA